MVFSGLLFVVADAFGGKLVAEFDGSTGALKKEYIYGATGLVATIVPNAQSGSGTQYTTTDSLGSPRVVTNSSAAVVSRHDYMPFGEELGSGVGGRTTGMGYSVADGIRKKFTGYERDSETGLDYAQARYFSSAQGRFTSPDPLLASAKPVDPQSWNRYSYVGNNPMNFIDPSGMAARPGGRNISNWNGAMASEQASDGLSPWPDVATETRQSSPQQPQPKISIDIGEPPPPLISTVTIVVPEPTEYINEPTSEGFFSLA